LSALQSKELIMTSLNTTKRRVAAAVGVAAAGLAFIAPACGDAQYKVDRTYCMSGEASEARDLCLNEAAAAQAERQKGLHRATTHHRHPSVSKDAPAAPEKHGTNS